MAKTVEGWLCRDAGHAGYVVFFPTAQPRLDGALWKAGVATRWWTANQWRETYDLEPPEKGEKFYVEMDAPGFRALGKGGQKGLNDA